MAITKTITFNYVSSYPAEDASGAANLNSSHPKLVVVETVVFDDSSDDTLPVSYTHLTLPKMIWLNQ